MKNDFERSGNVNQDQILGNKTAVTVSGQNQFEVNRKIKELLIKEEDYFKCTACGKISKDSSNMKRHAEVHIEGLSYECQICNSTFR